MPWLNACLCHQEKKRPSISPPIHLLLKPEADSQSHTFRCKVFKRPRPCNLCHQPIHHEGSCCRVCKYVCHKACENKHTYADSAPMKNPLKAKQQTTLTTQPRAAKSPGRFGARTGRMDLSYVTERIIALWVPGDVSPTAFRQGQQKAAHMLQTKHGNNYMVFNLSEPRRVIRRLHERVRELGWPADLAPPLERLCSVCKDIESWLSGDVHRIAVIHASGSKDRIGVVIAAYMHYSSICGSADQALDRFAMGRYLDDKVGDLEQPSHKRYVEYFSGLLSGSIRINSAPLYLTHVTVLGAPAFEPAADDGSGGGSGGCRAFLKVYEGLIPVYTSGVYTVCGGTRQFTVNVAGERSRRGLQLRGDILLKCYHRHYNIVPPHPPSSPGQSTTPTPAPSPDRPQRELIFACQFHTCAVTDYTLSFTRQELDFACQDLRFPLDGAVELHFSATPEIRLPSPAPTPAVPVDTSDDPVTRWDSYENVLLDADTDSEDLAGEGEEAGVSHTLGPLDGSLYATISKKQELQQQTTTSASPQQQQQQPQQPVGSPHTVSMDSGISSAGNGLLVHNKQQNVSPPPNGQQQQHLPSPSTSTATPLSPEDHHRALDELLNDMLLTVENIPDLPPPSTSPYGSHGFCRHDLEQPPHYHHVSKPVRAQQLNGYGAPDTAPDDIVDPNSIPYHARQDSRPFTYGAIPTSPRQQQGSMLQMHPGLASPSLVRKASFKSGGVSTSTTLRHHSPSRSGHPEDLVDGDMSSPSPRDYHRYNHNSPQSPRSPEFHDGHIVSMNTATTTTTSSSNLTWLQRQQQKLRERKEVQLRTERYPAETRLMSELRFIQQHPYSTRLSASHRVDGYTSDTTHFADDDDDDEEEDRVQGDFTVPLHINTTASPTHKLNSTSSAPASPMLPNRTSSRHYQSSSTSYISSTTSPLGRQKSDTSFDRERPFVAVKRAHEQNRKLPQSSPSSPAPPLGLVLTHHNGHDNKDTTTVPDSSGLLTLVQESAQQLQLEVGRGTDSTECVSSSSSVTIRETTSVGSSSNNTINGNNNYTGQSQQPQQQQQLLPPPPPPPPLPLPQQQQQQEQPPPDALASLIATLAATSAPASASSNTNSTACQQQLRDESFSSWQTTSISGDETGSPPRSSSPRPQTPAFPVHPRTPYVNSSSQQFESSTTSVTASSTGLPPKSPTTQRRMSNSGSLKNLRKWPSNSSISSKDRSPSPVSDVPTSVNIVPQQNISITSTSSGGSSSGRGISTTGTSNVSHPSDISYLQQSPKSSALQNGSTGQSSPTVYYGHSRRSSVHSNSEPPQEVSPAHIKFVRDTSKYWYKPTISREEAINMLRDQPPGTFVVRDSNSFPGAFGLALKVATPPPNVQGKSGGDPANELIRHFLIEPTSRGVKLKGCSNEPVFSSLSALVYQHSLMPMALPCRLLLPDASGSRLPADNPGTVSTAQLLLAQGAACNVLYLYTMDTESLTGPQAIKKAIQQMFSLRPLPVATVVHFKVSGQGITLTDNKRQLFFRRHYPVTTISYCGLDPDDHRWSQKSEETGMPISSNRVFGFIARKPASKTDNQCHIFAELEPEQPASAIVNFVSKVMMSGAATKANIV